MESDNSPSRSQPAGRVEPPVVPQHTRPASREDHTARLLTALAALPVVALVVWVGGWLLQAVVVVLALLAFGELAQAARRRGLPLLQQWGVVWILLWMLLPAAWLASPAVPVLMLVSLLSAGVLLYPGRRLSLESVAVTGLATAYCGLFRALPELRHQHHGLALVVLLLLGVWAHDIAGYYGGRALGRLPLHPVSPGKTREGLLVGSAMCLVACVLGGVLIGPGLLDGLAIGVILCILAPLGDLAESYWKRELKVKDLGNLLPGHGGVLDRADALLFGAVGIWLLTLLRH